MIDPDCAICCCLDETINSLSTIVKHIEWSCTGQKKKEDFGLTKNFVSAQITTIKAMQKYHEYHHSTGESLRDTNLGVRSSNEGQPPPPQRWRPGGPQRPS